jgi:hypothetical protein
MDRPPSPPGPRTHAQAACSNAPSPIVAPSHQTAVPRATSGSHTPPSYVATVMTPTLTSYFNPLCDDKAPDNDNPLCVDSKDEVKQPSPVLLTNPAGVDNMMTAVTGVADTPGGSGANTGNATVNVEGTATTADPPNKITPEIKAAIVAAVVAALKSSMETHLSPINSCLKRMQPDISSNHGHITKPLFPALETKLAALEDLLASKTRELKAKGQSLLEKFTALDGTIAANIGEKIATLETAVELATNNFESRIAALELHGLEPQRSPDDSPPDMTTATVPAALTEMMSPSKTAPRRKSNSNGDYVSPDKEAANVATRSCMAYASARERNPSLRAGPPQTPSQPLDAPRHGVSPVRNQYNPSFV